MIFSANHSSPGKLSHHRCTVCVLHVYPYFIHKMREAKKLHDGWYLFALELICEHVLVGQKLWE